MPDARPHESFASLRHPGYRAFFFASATAMLAESVEHVISYWVVFQKFHSPALGGFAVVSHWLPFLLFSVYTGALADRWDPRRLIQLGMVVFMFVSAAWAALFVTDTLQMWHAMALLVLDGIAGVLWSPPAQALIHDIVAPHQLQSAVRLTATARYLGLLMGPAIVAALLVALGPSTGLVVNVLLVIGLFSMTSLGFRTFSGVSVGLAGSVIGIHRSLALSAAVLFVVTAAILRRCRFRR